MPGLENIRKGRGFYALALLFVAYERVSSTLRSRWSLRLKHLYATYRLVDLREQHVRICLIQLALSNQGTHLIADAGEDGEGILGLALRE